MILSGSDRSRRTVAQSLLILLAISSAAVSAQSPRRQETETGAADRPAPWQRVLKGDDARRVEALEKQIGDLEKRAKFAEAVAPAGEVSAIRRRVQGEDHWQTIDAGVKEQIFARMASLPLETGNDLTRAIGLWEEAKALFEKGRAAEAEPLCRSDLAIRSRVLGDNHPETANAYVSLAMALDMQGKPLEAEPLLRTALRIFQITLGEEHPQTASCYNAIAINLFHQAKYSDAEPFLRKALAINRTVLGDDHSETAVSIDGLGTCLYFVGKYPEAEEQSRRALAVRVRLLGEDHISTAYSYNNLAVAIEAQGRFAEAEPLYERALAIQLRLFGEENLETATSYNNLAAVFRSQGKYAEAEALLRKAIAISSGLLGPGHLNTTRDQSNLAGALTAQRRYSEAEPLLEKVLEVRRALLGEDHRYTANAYHDVAVNRSAQGRFADSEPLFRRALAINARAVGEEHPDTATMYRDLAACLDAQGRRAEAASLIRKALSTRQRAIGEDHPDTADSYDPAPATNLNADGKYAEAEVAARSAATSAEAARLLASFRGLDRAAFATRESPLPLLAAIEARRRQGREAWERWEFSLGRGLIDDLAARNNRPLTVQERSRQIDLIGQLNALENQIALLNGAPSLSQEQIKQISGLKNQRLKIQGQLAQFEAEMVAKYKVAAGQVYDLARIQRQLPVRTALVGWIDRTSLPGSADPKGDHWACVVHPTGDPIWIRIVGTGPDQAWTEEDGNLPAGVRKALGEAALVDSPRMIARLADQRLTSLDPVLRPRGDAPAVKHLIILPSPALAGIPVEALLQARPESAPRYLVSYAPSGTIFAWLRERRGEENDKPAGAGQLLALGDPIPPATEPSGAWSAKPPDRGLLVRMVQPDSNASNSGIRAGDVLLSYAGAELSSVEDLQKRVLSADRNASTIAVTVWRDGKALEQVLKPGPLGVDLESRPAAQVILARREADALVRRTRGAHFARLPGTRREVQAIADLFDRKDVYLGSEASEQRLDDLRSHGQLSRFAVVHLATHGKMDDLSPMNSRLLLSQDRLPDPLTVPTGRPIYDGTITAGEVMSTWKLNADLVTLSACESGLGRQGGGEGFVGFSQAFFLAGARSLVLSLWEVDDRATSLLMTRFYQNWLGKREGLEPADVQGRGIARGQGMAPRPDRRPGGGRIAADGAGPAAGEGGPTGGGSPLRPSPLLGRLHLDG